MNIEPLGGALGLNGIPAYTNVFWVFSFAAVTVFTVHCLVHSTYGLGFIATKDDEIAAEAMGISLATVGREWAVARMWLRRELLG